MRYPAGVMKGGMSPKKQDFVYLSVMGIVCIYMCVRVYMTEAWLKDILTFAKHFIMSTSTSVNVGTYTVSVILFFCYVLFERDTQTDTESRVNN